MDTIPGRYNNRSTMAGETRIECNLRRAATLKEEGNALFKAGNYTKAIVKYATVQAYTRGLPGSKRGLSGMAVLATSGTSQENQIAAVDEHRARELEAAALMNASLCALKVKSGQKALKFADLAVETDPSLWKVYLCIRTYVIISVFEPMILQAHLRRTEALLMLNDSTGARKSLELCEVRINDSSVSEEEKSTARAAVASAYGRLGVLEKRDDAKFKKAFSSVFERLHDDDK